MPIEDLRGTAGDSIALAVTQIGSKYVRTTRFAIIGAGASGTVTLPPLSEVILNDFGGTVDAIITTVSGGVPTLESARDAANEVVSTTFDSLGNWVLVGVPVSYPVAIVYRVRQQLLNFDDSSPDIWGPSESETHGNWNGGSLHAIATTIANGFMSAVDKLKLDNLSAYFGRYFQSEEFTGSSAGVQDPTFNQAHRLTTPSIPAGTYKIAYSIVIERTGGTGRGIVRVQLDDTTNVLTRWEQSVSNIAERKLATGFRYLVLTAGVHNIDIDLSSTGAAVNTLAISGSTISIYRVA